MALFRKFFYRKPPDGLLEISERVYVFDCCFTTEVLEEVDYKVYIGGIVGQLRESLTDASFMVFNFREGESQSMITNILSDYDMTVMDYPRHYEGCPLLTMEMIHHFLRSSESWLSLGQQNVLLMHCERGGWPVLAFMLAALLIYRKQYAGEQKTLDMIYKQAPRELLQLMSPLNPLPSQLRYLQYVSRRNVASEWPPLDRALTLDCVIIRFIPNMDGEGGCRPIFRIYGQDPFMAADRTSKVLFSTPKKSKLVRQYKQVDCELVKIDIHCHIQGDVVLECISLDNDLEREEMMFRVMFNTAFIRSNILMLNRDDIDILWHAKDQFPKDFRAEVLFSEMDATASLISIELPNIEEKDGLPIEAFARVQEIFSNVDWLSPKADAALNMLQKITSSNVLQEKLLSSASSLDRNQLLDLSFEKLISEAETSEDNIRSPRLRVKTKQSRLSSELSRAASPIRSEDESPELQVALQLPVQSKIITQRIPEPSLSTPVSFRSSVQCSPRPILRNNSAPSALGITALLHDHSNSSSKEVIHPLTVSSPSFALSPSSAPSPSSALDSPKDIQPSKLPILPPSYTLEDSPTTTSTSNIGDRLLLHQLSLKTIKSSISQQSQTTSPGRSQLSPYSHQATPTSRLGGSPPSFNESLPSISSSSPLLASSPTSSIKDSFSVPTPPPPSPPPSLLDSPSYLVTSPSSRKTNGLVSSSPPPPSPTISFSPNDFVNSGSPLSLGVVSSAPPAPPPPGSPMKDSPTHAPPAPPPPFSGNKLSNVNGTSSQSHIGINNGNIPSIPGPPSSALFNSKGRGLGRLNSKNQSLPKRSNLKPYHWLKLTRAMQGSLWAETQKTDEASKAPEFDMSELESLFSAAAPNSDSGGSGGNSNRRASGPKSDKVHLIELRRAYNCEIMLSKVKIPLPDMMSSVLALDDSALDVDTVENLIKFCPTKEEMEQLKAYSGDKDNLGKCEQFFLELMKVPRVESKLRVFSFKIQFRLQVSDLRYSLNTINSASEEIRSSVKLKRVMQTILSLGNALNHGTARGSAIGFRLDSLLKLTDTRARNNKMTLMHYLCKVLAEKLPELLDFPKDLVSLEGSTKIQLKYLAEEMQAISKGLEKVVQELANSENDGIVSENFCRTLKGFLSHAEAEVRSLASLYSNVGRNADALALYFGEDPARCPFEQVVSTLFNFVRMFVRAHEENCKQLDYEKKKAQKEAAEKEKEKKEKLKVSTPKKESGFLMKTRT
ncbi:formin-like protein 18 [Momordica charantia]|uniref:Formin-like protein n=1 Tax=Momordica charantia TaxID=3673 RepID=A0A6J1C755_MOMCH|nr:formin-like protein 18 [Momordica charantia]